MSAIQLSPDGQLAAYHRTDNGQVNVWTLSLSDGQTRQLTFQEHIKGFPAWSHDGKFLAIEVADGVNTQIAVIPRTGGPLVPLTHDTGQNWYWFIVDGQTQLDPLNGFVVPNYAYLNSDVVVPGSVPQLWEATDVPHGELHHHFYKSSIASGLPGEQRDYYVYTPPGYDPKGSRTYPVLYLLHGYAQTAADWTVPGGANFILDNLIAQGKAKSMILVMPLGYGSVDIVSQTLLAEVLPEVESEYRVSKNRNDRAIAGLSLGAMESLNISFHNPQLFAWVGSFSAGDMLHSTHPLPMNLKQTQFRLLWISCGSDDALFETNRQLIALLAEKKFPVTAVQITGAHTWMVWHDNLIHFAPLLFQGK
ncbi:alpha/beta hydrolase-fold protein [Edaphobacter aggregans]|uniref:alpha/beta hydrolase-fold protein n=1 Tax=Edaphobacter aggregans TaxID=570835 RepID=UPI00146FE0E0|nr:alpha/beta hydrolase-fold protein [Edaphobacter aggregans]